MRRLSTVFILVALVALSAGCAGETSRDAANSTGTTTYNGSNSSPGGATQSSNTAAAPAAATPGQPGIKPPTDKKN